MTDTELTRALERGDVPNAGFHHADHLRVALVYLNESPTIGDAIARMATTLSRFAASVGQPQKYSQATTEFWMHQVAAVRAVMPDAPAPRFFFAPWDYDATFGRNWDARRVDATAWLSNHLFDRLHGSADFRKKFAGRWKQLREREFSVATIHRLIDDNARTLGDAAQRNATRWRTLDGPYPDRLTFEDDLAQMKAWVVARVKWLDAEIDRR